MYFRRIVISDRSRRMFLFSAFWITGLCVGTLLAMQADPLFLSKMRAANERVSIVVVLVSGVLPLGIAAYAVFIEQYWIFHLLCFLRALLLALVGGIIYRAFGLAGWLLQPMWQFTDMVSAAVFACFCFRGFLTAGADWKKDLCVCLTVCTLAAILDFYLVSPFLAALYQ